MTAAIEAIKQLAEKKAIIEVPDEFDLSFILVFKAVPSSMGLTLAISDRVESYQISYSNTTAGNVYQDYAAEITVPQYSIRPQRFDLNPAPKYNIFISSIKSSEFHKFVHSEFLKHKFQELTGVPIRYIKAPRMHLNHIEGDLLAVTELTEREREIVYRNNWKLLVRLRRLQVLGVSYVNDEATVFLDDADKAHREIYLAYSFVIKSMDLLLKFEELL